MQNKEFVPSDVSKKYTLKKLHQKKSDLESELKGTIRTTKKSEIKQEINEVERAIKEVEGYKEPLGIIR